MSDVTDFLVARIAEVEERIHRLDDCSWMRSVVAVPPSDGVTESVGIERAVRSPKAWARVFASGDHVVDDGWRVHDTAVELWSPDVRTRVLADCAAKRQIVEAYTNALAVCVLHSDGRQSGSRYRQAAAEVAVLAPVLSRLALPFADHPDYLEEWQP